MSDTPETDAVRDNVFDIWGGWSDNAAKKLLKHARRLERERDSERALADRLAEAANAVIDQWETPNWRLRESTAKYMNTLRNTVTAWKEARSE